MDQRIINLFDEYTHKPLTRQDFLGKLARLTGSMSAALAILPMLEVNYTKAVTVHENDEDIIAEDITYQGDGVTVKGYLARPKKDGKYGGVIVIHENRGLNPHIQDVTRRVAKAGFIGLAPDALSPFDYLKTRKECNGKIACVGFCWGGGMANDLAVNSPELKAAVAFYGRQPKAEDVSKIKARVQLHYGSLDDRIDAGIPAYEDALKKAGTKYELFMYEGAQHAFHNDTAPTRYNEAAAKLAWQRTIKLFSETIS